MRTPDINREFTAQLLRYAADDYRRGDLTRDGLRDRLQRLRDGLIRSLPCPHPPPGPEPPHRRKAKLTAKSASTSTASPTESKAAP